MLIHPSTKYKYTYVLGTFPPTYVSSFTVTVASKIFFFLFLPLLFSCPKGQCRAWRHETGVSTSVPPVPYYAFWVNEFCEPWSNLAYYQSQKPWKYKCEKTTLPIIRLLLRLRMTQNCWKLMKPQAFVVLPNYRSADLGCSHRSSLPNTFLLVVETTWKRNIHFIRSVT